jgi:hypothetical protein
MLSLHQSPSGYDGVNLAARALTAMDRGKAPGAWGEVQLQEICAQCVLRGGVYGCRSAETLWKPCESSQDPAE